MTPPLYVHRDGSAHRLAQELERAELLDDRVIVQLTNPDDGLSTSILRDGVYTNYAPLHTWRQLGLLAEYRDVILRRARLVRSASVKLRAQPTDYYKIQVVLVKEGSNRVDVLGTWDGSQRDLAVNTSELITSASLDLAVPEGWSVWVQVTRKGLPPTLQGTAVQLTFGRAGQ